MAERINTPFTNEHFIAFCEKMLGQPYWYGTCLYKCRASLLSSKSSQYPDSYTSSRQSRYQQDIAQKKVAADCIGACKGYAWTGGGLGVLESIGNDNTYTSKYGSNGCPDKGANSMFTYAKSKGVDWGVISTLPEIVGLALYKSGHAGYYAGNGYAIEWKGFSYGCCKTKVAGRGWTHWYKLPFINYSENDVIIPAPAVDNASIALGDRLLKKGVNGTDVVALQEALLKLGYTLPRYGADGKYGEETEKAVLAFQKTLNLKQDGLYGSQSHVALMATLSDQDDEEQNNPETIPDKWLQIKGDNVPVMNGNGTQYTLITTVNTGVTFPFIATADNGWHAIVVSGQVGWVVGDHSQAV
ncbi:MAG: peptidoglycan-binding protein [Eubacteriales bacterium]|nr:peptidoglycan-binding protein [Eubacteriales bacterium]MDD4513580.1 peptidoglycan-binding protein [Eubacteriales bacterium]